MLSAVPEPDWKSLAIVLISTLVQVRDKMIEMDETVVIRAPMVATLITQMLKDSKADDGVKFLEHTQKSVDVITLGLAFG
jgi:hypothetical protein